MCTINATQYIFFEIGILWNNKHKNDLKYHFDKWTWFKNTLNSATASVIDGYITVKHIRLLIS